MTGSHYHSSNEFPNWTWALRQLRQGRSVMRVGGTKENPLRVIVPAAAIDAYSPSVGDLLAEDWEIV